MTKRQIFEALNTMTFEDVIVGDAIVTDADIKDFIEKSIAQIDARNEKAKERQAQKKAEGDELRAQVKAVLGTEPMKVTEIVAAINDPEVTSAKVVSRLTQLVNAGDVVKEDIKVDGRTLKVYTIAE
jgi:hypothetical protein